MLMEEYINDEIRTGELYLYKHYEEQALIMKNHSAVEFNILHYIISLANYSGIAELNEVLDQNNQDKQ